MPLRHLIALILDTHPRTRIRSGDRLRKTSLLSRSIRRRAVKLADMGVRIAQGFRLKPMFGSIPSSRCQTTRVRLAALTAARRTRNSKCSGRATPPTGGARRDRTDDLLLAKQALSQLSYGPLNGIGSRQPARKR